MDIVDSFIRRFLPEWTPSSFEEALSSITDGLREAFRADAASLWVPRGSKPNEELNPIVLAFTTLPPSEFQGADSKSASAIQSQKISQVIMHGNDPWDLHTAESSQYFQETSNNKLLPKHLGFQATWSLPLTIRNLRVNLKSKQQLNPLQVVVTLHGSRTMCNELNSEMMLVIELAQSQLEKAVWEKQDRLLEMSSDAIASISESRSTAVNDLCIRITKLLGFYTCTIYRLDRDVRLLRVAGNSEHLSSSELAQRAIPFDKLLEGPIEEALNSRIGLAEELFRESRGEELTFRSKVTGSLACQTIAAGIRDSKSDARLYGVIRLDDKLPFSCGDDNRGIVHPLNQLNSLCIEKAADVVLPIIRLDEEIEFREMAWRRIRHDQRVPATAIRDFAQRWGSKDEYWLKKNLSKLKQKLIDTEDLAELMLLLADLARISSEGFSAVDLKCEPTPLLSGVVVPLVKMLEGYARDEKLKYRRPIWYDWASFGDPPGFPVPLLRIDPGLCKVAFYNVLDNAIKYAHSGTQVEVRGRKDSKRKYFIIDVENHGIEIQDRDKEKIFKPLYRTQSAKEKSSRGVGLGLGYSKQIMEVHGGDIEVTSTTPTIISLLFPFSLRERRP